MNIFKKFHGVMKSKSKNTEDLVANYFIASLSATCFVSLVLSFVSIYINNKEAQDNENDCAKVYAVNRHLEDNRVANKLCVEIASSDTLKLVVVPGMDTYKGLDTNQIKKNLIALNLVPGRDIEYDLSLNVLYPYQPRNDRICRVKGAGRFGGDDAIGFDNQGNCVGSSRLYDQEAIALESAVDLYDNCMKKVEKPANDKIAKSCKHINTATIDFINKVNNYKALLSLKTHSMAK